MNSFTAQQFQPQPQPPTQPQPQKIQQTQQQNVVFTQPNQPANTPSQIIKQVSEVKPVIQVNASSNNLVQVQNQTPQTQIKSQTNQVTQVAQVALGQKQSSQPSNQSQGVVNQTYTQFNQVNEATKSNKNIQINQGSQQNINAAQSNKVSFNQSQSAIQQNQKIDLAPQTNKLVVQAFNFPSQYHRMFLFNSNKTNYKASNKTINSYQLQQTSK